MEVCVLSVYDDHHHEEDEKWAPSATEIALVTLKSLGESMLGMVFY